MKSKCVGFVETMGYVPAVEAADAGVKSANVSLLSCETTSALITVVFEGDVGAVKAAVSAAYSAASKIGQVVGGHVIPRPSDEFGGFQKDTAYPFAAVKEASAQNTATEKKLTSSMKKKEKNSPAAISRAKKPRSSTEKSTSPPVKKDKIAVDEKKVDGPADVTKTKKK